ncbi:MAG: class I SAM-dependent methyltransferase [Sedimentisphaerales bacterium]|nr:class I SAM-dependent methyltransferase [Sedimentisphaerales bacterium]
MSGCNSVLEVGCGIGQNISGHPEATGIDISRFAVDECIKRGIDARLAAVEEVERFEQTYDGIICSHVLEHLENPYNVLRIFHDLLNSDGKLVISIPLVVTKSRKRDQHLYCWNVMEIRNLLERAGFKVVKHELWTPRMKMYTCYLPHRIGYHISWVIGRILHYMRWKPGGNDLTVYAIIDSTK